MEIDLLEEEEEEEEEAADNTDAASVESVHSDDHISLPESDAEDGDNHESGSVVNGEVLERPQAPSPYGMQLIPLSGSETDSGGPSREPSEPPSQPSSRASTPQLPSRRHQHQASDTVRMEINLNASHNISADSDMDSDSDGASHPSESSASRGNSPTMETEIVEAGVSGTPVEPVSHNESIADFRSPKKVKVPTPAKLGTSTVDDDEGACCPICFESWNNSGVHRVVSLKCGHLFGHRCIEKWLKGKKGKCPQCNEKASKSDVRPIYIPGKTLQVVDTTERDAALRELEREKEERRKAELAAAEARLRFQMAVDECNRMKEECDKQRQQMALLRSQSQSTSLGSKNPVQSSQSAAMTPLLGFEKSMKISEGGGCRVMTYSTQLGALCISQPSTNSLFPGFGVKKLNVLDFRTMQYVSIHSKTIRDAAFNPRNPDGLLLSCSIDKTVRMTSLMSNTVVQTYTCNVPLWSCTWDLDDWNYFYAGQQNGIVCVFDIRNTATHVEQLNTEGSKSPVVAVHYVGSKPESAFKPGGLLVGQLERSTFFERRRANDYKVHALPLEGSLTSLSVSEDTRHLLATYRPSSRHSSVRHQVYELACQNLSLQPDVTDHMCSCNSVHTFQGGSTQKQLGHNKLVTHPQDSSRLFVCAGDEASLSTLMWDVNSGILQQKLSGINAPVIDICSLRASGENCYLTTLTDKQLNIYKWKT